VVPPASCAAQKTADSGSGDGIYWINPGAGAIQTYCDMAQKVALCATVQGTHTGATRDASHLGYSMSSVLDPAAGTCEFWALECTADGYPLDGLGVVAGNTMTTCQALGFMGDDSLLSGCPFGSAYSNCGFTAGVYRYGNSCSGCTTNDGQFSRYVLQGPMTYASVITSHDGATRSRCSVR
jgi:hypothetical protein